MSKLQTFLNLQQESEAFVVRQVHGSCCIWVTDLNTQAQVAERAADGLITTLPEAKLAVKLADCLGLAVFHPATGTFAAAHVGWRGAFAGIVSNLVRELQVRKGVAANQLIVRTSPFLQVDHFQVQADFIAALQQAVGIDTSQNYLQLTAEGTFFDLGLLVRDQLVEAGVAEANIAISDVCTYCDKALGSHRRSTQRKIPTRHHWWVVSSTSANAASTLSN